ncbi:hypothetical protein RRG08_035371 [Elysia crispata]|uniref:Uncharacterized protein n=1 Tax=Elysia crispata TaxID=231223 RepID=A0AAE0Y3C2_9GAST|nr:hypothetical protein RRG08_035371 [Elysia crispata]
MGNETSAAEGVELVTGCAAAGGSGSSVSCVPLRLSSDGNLSKRLRQNVYRVSGLMEKSWRKILRLFFQHFVMSLVIVLAHAEFNS